jgi:hypothetical protein
VLLDINFIERPATKIQEKRASRQLLVLLYIWAFLCELLCEFSRLHLREERLRQVATEESLYWARKESCLLFGPVRRTYIHAHTYTSEVIW